VSEVSDKSEKQRINFARNNDWNKRAEFLLKILDE
jgi:hypothetical protein